MKKETKYGGLPGILALAAAVCLLAGGCPLGTMDNYAAGGGTGDSPTVLVEAPDLTGSIPAPVTGDKPVTGFYAGKYGGTVLWKTGGQEEAGVFREGAEYEAAVILYPAAGYGFPEQVAVTHKGTGEAAVTFTRADDGTVSGAVRFPPSNTHPLPLLTAGPEVRYDDTGAVSIRYTFDREVTATAGEGWMVAGSGTKTVTAAPLDPAPGTALSMTLAAANQEDETKTAEVPEVTVMPVSGVFSRPASGEVAYTVAYYDSYGVTGLKSAGGTGWFLVTDAGLKQRFNAIYTPNAPGGEDVIESGKTAVAYTQAVSEAVLGLFSVTLGSNADGSGDLYEIKGEDLPEANIGGAKAATNNPLVIDIGVPGGEANSGLPVFYIPHQALGTEKGSYGYLRFRVNNGASVVILADNSGYIENGPKHSCPAGYFHNGCIEVMSGGMLRDGAYEGFPLGANAVILNRPGSYLGIGPEADSADATNAKVEDTYEMYYKGWLIGPSEGEPRIEWDGGSQDNGYIEVRPGKLAISASVTVKKAMGLIYSVWFVDGPTVTIDAEDYDLAIDGRKGLFANGADYKFYGTKDSSGGEHTATIVIMPGSTLHQLFLTAGETDAETYIINNTDEAITIENKGGGEEIDEETYETGTDISGYLNWSIPPAPDDGED